MDSLLATSPAAAVPSSSLSSYRFRFRVSPPATINPSFLKPPLPSQLPSVTLAARPCPRGAGVIAASAANPSSGPASLAGPFLRRLAAAVVFLGAAVSSSVATQKMPARAEPQPVVVADDEHRQEEKQEQGLEEGAKPSSPLSEFLEANAEAVDALKSLLQQKLENGEDEEALKILGRLAAARPSETEWKFLTARLLGEMGDTQNARKVFEEILELNPLSFEALFENALLMDRCGEGEAVITRLGEALRVAEKDNKSKEARDVRLIMAQMKFLQKNVEEALRSYQELSKEDPSDFRPYFCQGMIYSLLDRNSEAKEQFAKYRELSPKKFEVEGFLRTPLSRMKLFGTDAEN